MLAIFLERIISMLKLYSVSDEYNEIRWIERNDKNILENSRMIYNLKIHESERRTTKNSKLLNSILPFKKLEKLHDNWKKNKK